MRNIGVGQIAILFIICFLLFGDLSIIKKKVKTSLKSFNSYLNRK